MKKISAALDLRLKNPAVSGNLRFTPLQLYYEVCRTVKKPKGLNLRTSAALLTVGALPAFGLAGRKTTLSVGLLVANALAAGGLLWLRKTPHILTTPFSFEDFENALEIYLRNQPRPTGLLAQNNDEQPQSKNSAPVDLARYGLPRLLICQSPDIAQMLRANNFHLEAACAVLSLAEAAPLGYLRREMLERAGQARIFFLHDASLTALMLLPDLRERLNLPDSASLQILGLRPIHAERLHLFAQQGEQPVGREHLETFSFLSDAEKRWLADGWRAEVAAVSPVRLLRVLRRLALGLPSAQNALKISLPPRELGFM